MLNINISNNLLNEIYLEVSQELTNESKMPIDYGSYVNEEEKKRILSEVLYFSKENEDSNLEKKQNYINKDKKNDIKYTVKKYSFIGAITLGVATGIGGYYFSKSIGNNNNESLVCGALSAGIVGIAGKPLINDLLLDSLIASWQYKLKNNPESLPRESEEFNIFFREELKKFTKDKFKVFVDNKILQETNDIIKESEKKVCKLRKQMEAMSALVEDPITCELMTDPVMVGDGRTYERSSIRDEWLRQRVKIDEKIQLGLEPKPDYPVCNYNEEAELVCPDNLPRNYSVMTNIENFQELIKKEQKHIDRIKDKKTFVDRLKQEGVNQNSVNISIH